MFLLQSEFEQSVEQWLQFGTQMLSRSAEAIAAVIIALGILRALFTYIAAQFSGSDRAIESAGKTEAIRLGLGRALGLGLEFLLAADIVSTAVAPTWDAIGKLAAIATIRTLLNYFLARELRQEEQKRAGAGQNTTLPTVAAPVAPGSREGRHDTSHNGQDRTLSAVIGGLGRFRKR